MASHLVKIAGIWALSAATVTGMSLIASNARAAEEDADDNIAAEANDANAELAEVDEGNTAESSDAIHRGWRRYPGFYNRYPGYRFYNPYLYRPYYRPFYRPYRYFPAPYRYYRPYYGPGYGPWGYGW